MKCYLGLKLLGGPNKRFKLRLTLIIDYYPPMKTSTDTLKIIQDHTPERLFRVYRETTLDFK